MTVKCPKCHSDNPDTKQFCADCGTQLGSVEEFSLFQTETLETPLKELKMGSTFADRYQIIEELGKGGMGKVYKVLDTHINEKVALKLLKPEIAADKKTIERFSNELKFARRIRHKNVCGMYDLGRAEGTSFITMEYVQGEDLKSMIRMSTGLTVGTVLSVGKQICDGLAEAHALGVVHRDLKPQNIMIDKGGNAKIMDFGIARSIREKGITGPSVLIGTPEYMSPEQAEAKEVDHRSDIYSLGIILYEMATGRVPFEGETALSVAMKHKGEVPKNPKQINPNISNDLAGVILKCLEKDKAKRYQTAVEVHSELEKIEKGIPTADRVIPERKTFTSRQITVTFGLKKLLVPALAIIGIAIIGVVIWQLLPEKKVAAAPKIENSIAVISFENQTGDDSYDYLQKAIPNLLITDLENTGYLHVTTWERMYDLLKQVGKADLQVIDRELGFDVCRREGVESIVIGSFIKAGDTFATDVKVLDVETKQLLKSASSRGIGADSILNTQIDELSREISLGVGIARQKIEEAHMKVVDVTTASMEAYKYYLEGVENFFRYRFKEALPLLEKAVSVDPEFAIAQLYLSWLTGFLGDTERSLKAIEKAKSFSGRASAREGLFIKAFTAEKPEESFNLYHELIKKYPNEKRAYFMLGHAYWGKKMPDKAIEYFSKAVELDPQYGMALANIAYLYVGMKNYAKALEFANRSISVSPGDALPISTLGDIYWEMGKFDQGIAEYKKALEIDAEQYAQYFYVARAYAFKEDYSETLNWIDRYIEKGPKSLKATGYFQKGFFYYWLGLLEPCMASLEAANKIAEETGNSEAKYGIELFKGFMNLDRNDFQSAKVQFKRWFDHNMKAFPQFTASYRANYCFFQGLEELKQGKLASAKSKLEEMRSIVTEIPTGQEGWGKFNYSYLSAEISMRENSPDKAIAILEGTSLYENIQFEPNWTQAYIYSNVPFMKDGLARAYQQKGDIDKAIAEYEKLITYLPEKKDNFYIHPKYHFYLAKLYEQKGLRIKAAEQYQKFLDLWKDADPGLPEVEDARQRLAGLKGV